MKESIRCGACNALLFRADIGALAGAIEIKCRRCRQINHLRPMSPSPSANRAATGD
ncbi:MAG: Com family DNA-binding transcriptional regulator [Novosphingobium sp.]|nr:Com family DNA-binding transcriptional regulator [Novosphingobium sp.]